MARSPWQLWRSSPDTAAPAARKKAALGPVALHRGAAGALEGLGGDVVDRRVPLGRGAELGQGRFGQAQVGGRFDPPGDGQRAGLPQQGQGEEQAGDILAGDVSGQRVGAGGQLAGDGQGGFSGPGQDGAVGRQLPVQGEQGPLGQPPLHLEGGFHAQSRRHRQEKAQGGAALAAG